MQSFTYTFAAERRRAASATSSPSPRSTAHYRDSQPYSLTIDVHGGEIYGEQSGRLAYRLYEQHARAPRAACGPIAACSPPKRSARRVGHDLTMFNWPGNDYRDRSIIDRPAGESPPRSRTPSG